MKRAKELPEPRCGPQSFGKSQGSKYQGTVSLLNENLTDRQIHQALNVVKDGCACPTQGEGLLLGHDLHTECSRA